MLQLLSSLAGVALKTGLYIQFSLTPTKLTKTWIESCIESGRESIIHEVWWVHFIITTYHSHFVSLQIAHMNELKGLVPLLQQLQEGKLLIKKPQFANKLYSVELLRLYWPLCIFASIKICYNSTLSGSFLGWFDAFISVYNWFFLCLF